MSRRPKSYLAKSADSGRCGNKAGLPSTVGVSMAHRRAFKMSGKGCCKNDLPDGCRGATDRARAPGSQVAVTLTSVFDYSASTNGTITVTLSDGLPSRTLVVGDFTIPTGLNFTSATKTTATFTINSAPGSNTYKSFEIKLDEKTVKNASGSYLSGVTTTVQVLSPTTLSILSVGGLGVTAGNVIFQFSDPVCLLSGGAITKASFLVAVTGSGQSVSTTDTLTFIGDQVGGQTYQLNFTSTIALVATNPLSLSLVLGSGANLTVNQVYKAKASGGVSIGEDDAGRLATGTGNGKTKNY